VGIFIEKGMDYPRKILTMHALEPYDLTANISKIFASNPEISVDVLNVSSQNNEELVQLYGFSDTHILSNRNIDKSLLDRYDLMLINIETWKKLVDDRTSWLSHTPSVLILSPEKKPYLY
jgi:hypothetical protein